MNKYLKNNSAMTLIELLGAIVILIIITALIFPILLGGMNTAKDIQTETILRNEADYLMASVIKELYITKETEIHSKQFPATDTSNYFLTKTNGKKTGFINNELIVDNKLVSTNNSAISLLSSEVIDLEDGQYKIILNLLYEKRKPVEMKFVNVIRTINDIEKKEPEA